MSTFFTDEWLETMKLKDKLPYGPWVNEPDLLEWNSYGLECKIRRNAMFALCGYVFLPKGHSMYGINYNDVFSQTDVHGGLTYSQEVTTDDGRQMWVFGFDCSHLGDFVPLSTSFQVRAYDSGTYRDIEYVRDETTMLAGQLAKVVAN
jgi:hypothetical protein